MRWIMDPRPHFPTQSDVRDRYISDQTRRSCLDLGCSPTLQSDFLFIIATRTLSVVSTHKYLPESSRFGTLANQTRNDAKIGPLCEKWLWLQFIDRITLTFIASDCYPNTLINRFRHEQLAHLRIVRSRQGGFNATKNTESAHR
jgi:hypothetical protein